MVCVGNIALTRREIMIFGENHEITSLQNALVRLKNHVYYKICDLDMTIYFSKEPLTYADRMKGEKRKVNVGERWGDLFDCAWFNITGTVPKSGENQPLVFIMDINGEAVIYDDTGCPYRGITNVNTQFDRTQGLPGKRVVRYKNDAKEGEKIDFWMDAGCNDLFGNYRSGTVVEMYLAGCNYTARKLYYDFFVMFDWMKSLSNEDPARYELMDALFEIRDTLIDYTPEEYEHCFTITKRMLSKENGEVPFKLTAIGNSHLDLAWVWPIRETKRKAARTFSTALENMDRYDEYLFGASQGQLYEWVKQDYPMLHKKIKDKIDENRWEIMGSMWVESDTNIPSGESLIRQILYGNDYWEKEFGKRCNYVWLPDTFGYSAALPQIMRKCGMDYFLTIKISWNKYTRFPYTNFIWRGIDGSEIPTHMPPSGNYLSSAAPSALHDSAVNSAKNGQYIPALLPYGIGDGGGGPSPCHLEYLMREKNLRGLPPVKQGFISDFLDEFGKFKSKLPIYDGELYLECHLATYTTQSRSKRYNRKTEQLLHDVEMLSAVAMRTCGYSYPQSELEEIWKEVLLYQFHDVLPGTSINRVYDESHATYEILMKKLVELKEKAQNALIQRIDTSAYENPAIVFNTLSFARSRWIKTNAGYQYITVPAMGYIVIDLSIGVNQEAQKKSLENDILAVTFDNTGAITSIYNKVLDKELLSAPSNLLLIYDDTGDAWEIEREYLNKKPTRVSLVSSKFEIDGPVCKVIQEYSYHSSTFTVEISLAENSDRLEMHAIADWQEDGRMLRIRFEHAVSSNTVDCEIQFGHIARSTLYNTEAEKAQYEVCAHRWIKASQPGMGFALLNDCKYGYFAKRNVIEMNCLRSSYHPGRRMEIGKQEFSYAVYSDNGCDGHVAVTKAGYDFNYDLDVVNAQSVKNELPSELSFISMDKPNIIVETVKKCEYADDIVIRAYELSGVSQKASIELGLPTDEVRLSDMTERNMETIENDISFHGFEIQTVIV